MEKNIIDEYGLFLCKLDFEVMILAKSEADARTIFNSRKNEMLNDSVDYIDFSPVKVEDVKNIPEEWMDSVPYVSQRPTFPPNFSTPAPGMEERKLKELTCKYFMRNYQMRKQELAEREKIKKLNAEMEKLQVKFSFYDSLEQKQKMSLTN